MGITIFHVDDDEDIRFAVESILTKENYTVKSYKSTDDLFENVGNAKPDLIILDVMVEECDSGLKTYDNLKQAYPNIPTMLLTSLGEMVRPYFENNDELVWILEKPVEPQKLISSIKSNLKSIKSSDVKIVAGIVVWV